MNAELAARAEAATAPDLSDQAIQAGLAAMTENVRALTAATERFAAAEEALRVLLATRGRIVVTGLGKSGLVGAKLAATLASTGSPAIFVHAADALHGDSGMVIDGDLLVAISNSGETAEVLCFAETVLGRGVPVVAMTGCGGGSSLCRLATAVIDFGVEREADPWDLVPSASTTVCQALGDALAIALMVAHGFGPDDFHVHHPAGALGDRLNTTGRRTPGRQT